MLEDVIKTLSPDRPIIKDAFEQETIADLLTSQKLLKTFEET